MDDGTEVTVEPDMKAVQTALSIMDRRSKLLGMEQTNISVQMDVIGTDEPIRATLAGNKNRALAVDAFDPETEVKKLLEIMGNSGVLPAATINQLLGTAPELEQSRVESDIVDAEVVEPNDR
jgi:hypothetical protein